MKKSPLQKLSYYFNSEESADERFERWIEYRERLTDLIIDNSKREDLLNNILIFGAGRCDTIDISKLSNYFDETILTDWDNESMKNALEKYELKNNKKVRKKVVDYSGNNDRSLEHKMIKLIVSSTKNNEIENSVNSFLKKLDRFNVEKQLKKSDVVISDCVITQFLNIHPFFNVSKANRDDDYFGYVKLPDKLNQFFINKYMPSIVEHYNKLVTSMVNKNGILIYLTDIIEFNAKNLDNKNDFISQEDMEEIFNNYKTNLIDIAYYAINNLSLKSKEYGINLLENRNIIWEFNETKKYIVQISIYKKM